MPNFFEPGFMHGIILFDHGDVLLVVSGFQILRFRDQYSTHSRIHMSCPSSALNELDQVMVQIEPDQTRYEISFLRKGVSSELTLRPGCSPEYRVPPRLQRWRTVKLQCWLRTWEGEDPLPGN